MYIQKTDKLQIGIQKRQDPCTIHGTNLYSVYFMKISKDFLSKRGQAFGNGDLDFGFLLDIKIEPPVFRLVTTSYKYAYAFQKPSIRFNLIK